MTFSQDMIDMIDQRIRLAAKQDRATGTVVTRDPAGYGAQVLFTGSTTAVPVKCVGGVFCRNGDRVILDRYGSDWVITGAYVGPGYGEAFRRLDGAGTTTAGITSGSFIDMTEFGTLTFIKGFDNTSIRVAMLWSGTGTVVGQRVAFGVRLTPTEGGEGYTPVDYAVGSGVLYAANQRMPIYSSTRVTGVPSGTYTVTYRWRRVNGSGTLTSDTADPLMIELDERTRQNSPGL